MIEISDWSYFLIQHLTEKGLRYDSGPVQHKTIHNMNDGQKMSSLREETSKKETSLLINQLMFDYRLESFKHCFSH